MKVNPKSRGRVAEMLFVILINVFASLSSCSALAKQSLVIESKVLITSYTRRLRHCGKARRKIRNDNVNCVILFYWFWATRPRVQRPMLEKARDLVKDVYIGLISETFRYEL